MRFVVAVAAIVTFAACTRSPLAPESAGSAAAAASSATNQAVPDMQPADVLDVVHGDAVVGSARLLRNDSGISVQVGTSGLAPNEVYSLWWVIFPPGCQDPFACGIITNAAGAVTDGQGRAHFGGHLSTGPVPPADGSVTLAGGDFQDPRTADILLVIHHHGPKIPTLVGRMLSTFDTGCPGSCDDDPQIVFFPSPSS